MCEQADSLCETFVVNDIVSIRDVYITPVSDFSCGYDACYDHASAAVRVANKPLLVVNMLILGVDNTVHIVECVS